MKTSRPLLVALALAAGAAALRHSPPEPQPVAVATSAAQSEDPKPDAGTPSTSPTGPTDPGPTGPSGPTGQRGTSPDGRELRASQTAFHLTSQIAGLLDELSNAQTPQDEDVILGRIRPLLHPDVSVVTDGRRFSGRETVLEGMRIVHSRNESDSKRLETSPFIAESRLDERPATLTLSTVQQHWFTDERGGRFVMVNRDTKVTIGRSDRSWLVTGLVIQTVTGPLER